MNGWMDGWMEHREGRGGGRGGGGGGGGGDRSLRRRVYVGGRSRAWLSLRARGEGGWRASRVVARDEKNSRLFTR